MRNEKGQFVKGFSSSPKTTFKKGQEPWNKDKKFPEMSGENNPFFIHGLSHTRFWRIYINIRARCNNPKGNRWHIYGGRGIKVNWKSFEEFRDDMFESYQIQVKEFGIKNTTIDRIDVNGNYSAENCRWATPKEQSRNTRKNRMIEFNGQKLCLSEWAEKFGIGEFTVRARLKHGWSVEKALTTKIT